MIAWPIACASGCALPYLDSSRVLSTVPPTPAASTTVAAVATRRSVVLIRPSSLASRARVPMSRRRWVTFLMNLIVVLLVALQKQSRVTVRRRAAVLFHARDEVVAGDRQVASRRRVARRLDDAVRTGRNRDDRDAA